MVPVTDTLRERDGATVDRRRFVAAQTPQGFRVDTLRSYGSRTFLLDACSPDQFGGTGKSFNWDAAKLDQGLQGPSKFAGGAVKMVYHLDDATERKNVIAYLASQK